MAGAVIAGKRLPRAKFCNCGEGFGSQFDTFHISDSSSNFKLEPSININNSDNK